LSPIGVTSKIKPFRSLLAEWLFHLHQNLHHKGSTCHPTNGLFINIKSEVLYDEKSTSSLKKAAEVTHNMHQITYTLPESKHTK